jgi:hypothetical protein
MSDLDAIVQLTPSVRYVAIYTDGKLRSKQKGGVSNPSASDSDRYEELLVNPALLCLAGQRGRIDCGGLQYLIVTYGQFQQFVAAIPGGHVSVCFELDNDPRAYGDRIIRLARGE